MAIKTHEGIHFRHGTKRILTDSEEFEIMKLVFDKILWVGTALLAYGLYHSITYTWWGGLWYLITGAVIMLVFAWILAREFERLR
ncbi:MAG TPA: hypothetical protein VJ044_18420 [Candidatus Hodarchaeales archaeon]|nr:hypothetical protein [Candidatus Hodarchaeales archaeon]